jgi:hypothetical protein
VKALVGRKIGMTQILEEDGTARAITLVQAGPCVVTQLKSDETDGYSAVQIGFEAHKHPAKQQAGHSSKAKVETTPRSFHEIRGIAYDEEAIKPGSTIDVSVFDAGDEVLVQAKVKDLRELSRGITLCVVARPTVATVMCANPDRLAPCILKRFSRENVWQAEWGMIK